jgi:hypothetical protein
MTPIVVSDILEDDWFKVPISARSKQIADDIPAGLSPGYGPSAMNGAMLEALSAGLQGKTMSGEACRVLPRQIQCCSQEEPTTRIF